MSIRHCHPQTQVEPMPVVKPRPPAVLPGSSEDSQEASKHQSQIWFWMFSGDFIQKKTIFDGERPGCAGFP